MTSKTDYTYCFICGDSGKFCKGKHTKEEKKLAKFLDWVNSGGNPKTGVQVIDNHYTQFGQGYRDAMYDVYVQLTKTFNLKGFKT